MRLSLVLCLLLFCSLGLSSCPAKRNIRSFKGNDAVMLDRVRDIGLAINKCQEETAEWPQTLREVEAYLEPGLRWPDNPYTSQPIKDSGSPDFDPATSVGNVFYMKHYREEQISNYSLYVFGDKGLLVVLGNADFVPR